MFEMERSRGTSEGQIWRLRTGERWPRIEASGEVSSTRWQKHVATLTLNQGNTRKTERVSTAHYLPTPSVLQRLPLSCE